MSDRFVVCCESLKKSGIYIDALKTAGVGGEEVVLVTPEQRQEKAQSLAATAAGLMLCGGPDIEPSRYGEEARSDANLSLLPELDELEWDLLTGAQAGSTPVWAICRGMQTVNVFQGGTLWQDIVTQVDGTVNHDIPEPHDALVHTVHVDSKTESFGQLLAVETTEVNSRHHQAVKHVGRSLTVVATSVDGLIEVMVLASDEWWVKGVQWHPENLTHLTVQRRLWAEFVDTARARLRTPAPRR